MEGLPGDSGGDGHTPSPLGYPTMCSEVESHRPGAAARLLKVLTCRAALSPWSQPVWSHHGEPCWDRHPAAASFGSLIVFNKDPSFHSAWGPEACGWAQTRSPLTQPAGQRSGAPVHHGAWHRPGGVSGSRGHSWGGYLVTKSFKWGPPRLGLGVSEKPQKPRAALPGGTEAREPRK